MDHFSPAMPATEQAGLVFFRLTVESTAFPITVNMIFEGKAQARVFSLEIKASQSTA
jgi:hypothetical protein